MGWIPWRARLGRVPWRARLGWIPWRARLGWIAAVAVAGACLFLCYLLQSRTGGGVSSDGAANALQASDLLHGNLLLHGWWLSDVSFYTTELPEYALVEWVHGLRPDVVHICAALTYTLLVLLTALLARSSAKGREGVVRAVLAGGLTVAPTLGFTTNTLLGAPDHTGTGVPLLATLLLLDRFRPRWYLPPAVLLVLAAVQVADPLASVAGVAPIVVAGLYRAARSFTWKRQGEPGWFDLTLAVSAAVSLPAARYALTVIKQDGGFHVNPLPGPLFASAAALPRQLRNVGQCVLILFGADPIGQRAGVPLVIALLHLAGVAVAVLGLAAGTWQFFGRLDRVGQILVAGTFATLVAGWLGTHMDSGFSAHEIAVVLPFSAALAGRMLGRPLTRLKLEPVLAAGLAGYLGALGYAASQPAAPATSAPLAGLLIAHDLRDGLAGYWQANSSTLAAGGKVTVAPIFGASPYLWETNSTWYDPRLHDANFVVTVSGPPGETMFAKPAVVRTLFGKPAEVYTLGRYTVLVYDKNLLPVLLPVPAAG